MKFGRLLANMIHRWGRAGHKYILEWADLRHVPMPAGSIFILHYWWVAVQLYLLELFGVFQTYFYKLRPIFCQTSVCTAPLFRTNHVSPVPAQVSNRAFRNKSSLHNSA